MNAVEFADGINVGKELIGVGQLSDHFDLQILFRLGNPYPIVLGKPLEEVNAYNLKKKFIRVVNYKSKETEYTALEINLDCEAGVTEQMVRHWIIAFAIDVGTFSDYAKMKRGEPEKK